METTLYSESPTSTGVQIQFSKRILAIFAVFGPVISVPMSGGLGALGALDSRVLYKYFDVGQKLFSNPTVFIFCATFFIGWNCLHNDFVLDDGSKIQQNPDIRSISFSNLIYPYHEVGNTLRRNDPSRPLTFFTYQLNFAWGGLSPVGYRVVNLVLHAICALLVRAMVNILFPEKEGGKDLFLSRANITAILFLATPINFNTATYAYSRSELLCTVFGYASLLYHYRWRVQEQNAAYNCGLSVLMLFFGLASKQTAFITPILAALGEVFFVPAYAPPKPLTKNRIISSAVAVGPLLALVVAYFAMRKAYFGGIGDLEADAGLWPVIPYASTQPLVILRYLFMQFFPRGLCIDHMILPNERDSVLRVDVMMPFFVLLLVTMVMLFMTLQGSKTARVMLFSWIFYGISLAPTSSFFPTTDCLVERRVYFGSWGIFLAFAYFLEQHSRSNWEYRQRRVPVIVFFLVLFAAVSIERNARHATGEGVWREVLGNYADSVRGLNNLGTDLFSRFQKMPKKDFSLISEAIKCFDLLIKRNPTDAFALVNLGSIYNDPSVPELHDPDKAYQMFTRAAAVGHTFASPNFQLALFHHQRGEEAKAESFYKAAINKEPTHAMSHNNLGLLYAQRGDKKNALLFLRKALAYAPDDKLIIENLRKHEMGQL